MEYLKNIERAIPEELERFLKHIGKLNDCALFCSRRCFQRMHSRMYKLNLPLFIFKIK